PVVVAGYVSAQRRRMRRAQALAEEGLVATSASVRVRRRRHVPFALFVLALTVLVVALARPSTTVRTPRQQGTVIVALDVSNSMRATDVKPSRIEVAKAAAKSFVRQQATPVRIGVVAFADGAAAAGGRVDTVGIGTEAGTTFQYEGFTIATALDSGVLKQLSTVTDGTYHPSNDSGGLAAVTKTISLHFTLVSQDTEITG